MRLEQRPHAPRRSGVAASRAPRSEGLRRPASSELPPGPDRAVRVAGARRDGRRPDIRLAGHTIIRRVPWTSMPRPARESPCVSGSRHGRRDAVGVPRRRTVGDVGRAAGDAGFRDRHGDRGRRDAAHPRNPRAPSWRSSTGSTPRQAPVPGASDANASPTATTRRTRGPRSSGAPQRPSGSWVGCGRSET